MSRVGYLQGTDPILLSMFAAEGIETLPVSNTFDGHGKPINHLTKGEVNVIVGYLHKVVPNEQSRTSMFDLMLDNMLVACKAYNIPVLLVAPNGLQEKAKKLLGQSRTNVYVLAPSELEAQVRKYL
jgi:aconitase B